MTDGRGILVVNAGSSSVKFAVFGPDLTVQLRGVLEGIGGHPRLSASDAQGAHLVDRTWPAETDIHGLIGALMGWIESQPGAGDLVAVGHRVAIGGLEHSGPAMVTPEMLAKLQGLIPLAPLHQPRNLEPIEIIAESHPHLPQVACFDTAFHRTLPRVAQLYGLPRAVSDIGAHRYGFHGLSYEYIAGRLPDVDPGGAAGRTIVAHLGSGASLCALSVGKSIETSMGFSPLSGLVMGTRPGDLDPGLMIWLIREHGMTVDQVEAMLYQDSGLKGVSGISGDMRDLLASTDPAAAEAVELFAYKAAAGIGALTAALGGLDLLVFTAGIGEHSPAIRAAICERCAWLGLRLSSDRNLGDAPLISTRDSAVAVRVIPTDEERMVATHAASLALSSALPMEGSPK